MRDLSALTDDDLVELAQHELEQDIEQQASELTTLQSIEAKLDKNNDLLTQIVRTLSAIRAIYLGGGGSAGGTAKKL